MKDAKNSKYIFSILMLPVHKIPFTLVPSTRFSSWKPPSRVGFPQSYTGIKILFPHFSFKKSKILTVSPIPIRRSHRYWEKVIFMTLNYLVCYCELPFSGLCILVIFVYIYIYTHTHTHIYIYMYIKICEVCHPEGICSQSRMGNFGQKHFSDIL